MALAQPLPTQAEPPAENGVVAQLTRARQNADAWLAATIEEYPEIELDAMCELCEYVCKRQWRLQGETGASGRFYSVGPLCPVLWLFDEHNPLRRRLPEPTVEAETGEP